MKILKTMPLKFTLFLLLPILLSGCLPGSGSGGSAIDGGVWRSNDGGKILTQTNDILTVKGKVADIANVNINQMTFDPQDSQTIYLATESNGIIYSLDGGASWQGGADSARRKA